jgi:3-hydroxyacyl-CoA dehydrogenase
VISVDSPPVNALSHAVRTGLGQAIQHIGADPDIVGVVLTCAGRTFIAGADASEFGKPPASPTLREVVAQLETIGKPTIAAMHGTALGGGLELALACRYRLATNSAMLGLPEVKLGLIPGAGGTVKLPNLINPVDALRIIVTGEPVTAQEALRIGLIDAVVDKDLIEEAMSFLSAQSAGALSHRFAATQHDTDTLAELAVAAANLLSKSAQLEAPAAAVQAVKNAIVLPINEAMLAERQLFDALVSGSQSRALRSIFFAERAAARLEGVFAKAPAVERVGIVGSGTMGGGIAMAFANAGISVTIVDLSVEALARGRAAVEGNYAASLKRGSTTEGEVRARSERMIWTTDYAALRDSPLVIEAAFEDIEVKRNVIRQLDAVCSPSTVFATNTSYLDVDTIAAASIHPERVLGMHFFSPANVMKLVEIAKGARTTLDALALAQSVTKRIGKVSVFVGLCRGFVGNRMMAARNSQTIDLLLEGTTPADVDAVFTGLGWPMGPFQAQDLAGLDISWRNRQSLGTSLPIADDLVALGRLGQKTGRGFYRYEDGSRTPQDDPVVAEVIDRNACDLGKKRRAISAQEILERTHYALINEGARILEDGIARRSTDIDVVWVHGFGFPRWRGGPMYWAETIGLQKIVDRLDHWHAITGNSVFEASPLLRSGTLASSWSETK